MYISNNAYSGLNSLRGGLKHSYWSGSSLLDTTTFQSESGKPSCNYTISRNMQFGFQDTLSMDSNVFFIRWWGMYWYTYLFLFCFQYGVLKDTSQRLNFNELARVTKKYSLSVRVTGAADSSTGTSGINDSLNIQELAWLLQNWNDMEYRPNVLSELVKEKLPTIHLRNPTDIRM